MSHLVTRDSLQLERPGGLERANNNANSIKKKKSFGPPRPLQKYDQSCVCFILDSSVVTKLS